MYKCIRYTMVSCAIGIVLLIGSCKEKLPVDEGNDPINLDSTTIKLDSNLVAYWDFNDNTATDRTGHGFNGNLMNDFSTPSEGANGAGLKFNGVDNWFDVGNSNNKLIESGKPTTITAWVKKNTQGFAAIMTKWDADKYPYGSDWWFGLYDGEIHFTNNGDGCGRYCPDKMSKGLNIPNNEWTMIGVIITDNTLYYIKNGKIIDTDQGNYEFNYSSSHIRFGKQNDNTIGNESWFRGNLDEVRVYNRALNKAELENIYLKFDEQPAIDSQPPLIKIPDLVARWSFDDFTATDNSGNGFNGTKIESFQFSSGVRNKAINFYTDGSWIDIGNKQLLTSGKDMTITMWVRPTSVTGFHAILTKWEVENKPSGLDWWFGIYDGEIHFTNNATGCGSYCPNKMSKGLGIPTNEWTMIGVVITNNTVYYIKNGKILDQENGDYSFTHSAAKIRLGRQNGVMLGNESWYRGNLDEACVYNRALSENELMSLYMNKQ
jgi:hypothetical protein